MGKEIYIYVYVYIYTHIYMQTHIKTCKQIPTFQNKMGIYKAVSH